MEEVLNSNSKSKLSFKRERIGFFAVEIEALFQRLRKEHNATMGEIGLSVLWVLFEAYKRLDITQAMGFQNPFDLKIEDELIEE